MGQRCGAERYGAEGYGAVLWGSAVGLRAVRCVAQPMEIFVDDETKLTLHGLQQYYVKLKDNEKNRKLFDLLDVLEFNQVTPRPPHSRPIAAP